ncbi:universal stress protein [Nonomuraea zeae]|nr:universal stress protein [Nonomuraea zeae]
MNADDCWSDPIHGDGPRVLVVLDGSLASLAALRVAVTEARRRHAHLQAIRVLPGVGALPGLPDGHEFFARLREGVWASLREALGRVPADIDISTAVARGAGPALVAMAGGEDDLLVLGGGEGRLLRRWRSAAVSRYCVTHARCPVLTDVGTSPS